MSMKPESKSVAAKYMLVLLLGLAAVTTAPAQTFSVIYNFTGGSDGGNPRAGLTKDANGNLYGTTKDGGASGLGTVFKMTKQGTEIVLHSFAVGTDGANPLASLVLDEAHNLYGTTIAGGAVGEGTVFKVTRKGVESVLYSFTGGNDGKWPEAALTEDAQGNLYGTTIAGGANGNGVVFKLVRPKRKSGNWREKVLYTFGTGTDGAMPLAGVTFDRHHRIYGTTSAGGTYGNGTVFQLVPSKSGWTENVLYNFQMQDDGGTPYAGLIFDSAGNIYGAATSGGAGSGGTIFELTPSNGSWKFNTLYGMPGWALSGAFENLFMDAAGNIYGSTHCDGANSDGTVYKLAPSGGTWTYSELHTFTGGSDGYYVFSNLVFDKQGNLYGTASQGGANGNGVVYKITP